MSANTSLFGFDAGEIFPHAPQEGKSTEETLRNVMEFIPKLLQAYQDFTALMNTRARIGFQSMTDGTNTFYANEDGVITLSSGAGSTVTLSGGTMTISGPADLDAIDDGTTYGKVLNTQLSAGAISITESAVNGGDWTSNIDGYAAANVKDGAQRAVGGLTSSGAVNRVVEGSLLVNGTVSPTDAGLYMTSSYIGFYDGTSPYNVDGWQVFIKSDGDFYFGGDADNYIAWDGSNLNVYCQGGYIGSSTEFFDITNKEFQIACGGAYLWISSDGLEFWSGSEGTSTQYAKFIKNQLNLYGTGSQIDVKDSGSDTLFYVYVSATDNFEFLAGDASNGIVINQTSATYTMDGIDIGQTVAAKVKASEYKSSDGSAGVTTTFTNGDGDTVTVKNGIITGIA